MNNMPSRIGEKSRVALVMTENCERKFCLKKVVSILMNLQFIKNFYKTFSCIRGKFHY